MDATTRYSVGAVVPDKSVESTIEVLDTHWISQFCTPTVIQFNVVFANDIFCQYLDANGISPRPIPASRHNKNVLESKHKILRDIYLRCKDDDSNVNEKQIAQQSIRMSNELYGSEVCSAFELAKGFTRPIQPGSELKFVPDGVINARDTLIAKRKLNLTLISISTSDIPVKIGDMVQVFRKLQNETRGNWSNP